MPLTEQLRSDFWGLELEQGKMELTQGREFYCFFIVEHPHDTEFIKKQALSLIVAGCKEFHFYGKEEPVWHSEIDNADILVNPAAEDVAMTSGYDELDDFVFQLTLPLTCRTFVPQSVYLIYDDRTMYDEVKRQLKEQNIIR